MSFLKFKNIEKFQGHLHKKRYFEGWYYKIISKDFKQSIALIPGVSLNSDDPHAFIQIFYYTYAKTPTIQTHYVKYDIKSFSFDKDAFNISIANNRFSMDQIHLDIKDEDVTLIGDIDINHHTKLKQTILQPNIMGVFSYVPKMECNHGILSMDSLSSGILKYQEQTIDFTDAKVYIEKDWGKSFPSQYIWMQSNHFNKPNTSIMFSYATIPFLGLKFKGLIAHVTIDQRHYTFATYNFSRILNKTIKSNEVTFKIKKRNYALHIHATSIDAVKLKSPHQGKMIQEIKEGLSGEIEVELTHKKKLLLKDTGLYAGIEIMF